MYVLKKERKGVKKWKWGQVVISAYIGWTGGGGGSVLLVVGVIDVGGRCT
jgi:hypothetical protein